MDGDVQHIAAIVEDLLDTLAMVHVGIQDHRAWEPAFQVFGGNGGIVQVAETTGGVFTGVVAGRAAHGIGIALAGNQGIGRPECGLGRPVSGLPGILANRDRKSTRLNSSHVRISYAVFCLKKKKKKKKIRQTKKNKITITKREKH